ncbi:helix-turn-helix domain-containing protein [Streptomyces sp. NPDC024089]|uniref:helix-turn-helix domain-containing protein n=1 Tax=Streptomyces sp. NPDC024089 TaxID=3154328 RepID=UPI0033C1E6DC
MSKEAMDWAMEFAPPMPSQLVATLSGLARHADKKGRGAYPSVARLAAYACKSERSVQRDLVELRKFGLIRYGDQSKANHLPEGKRPEVYDLAVERTVPDGRAGKDEVTLASRVTLASSRRRGGKKKPSSDPIESDLTGDVDVRGDVDVTGDADVADGVTSTSQEGRRPRHPNQLPEPTDEPKDSCEPPAHESETGTKSLFDSPAASADLTEEQQQDIDFAAFYAAYPRKVGKGNARKAFVAAVKRGAKPADIVAASAAHRDHWARCKTETRFIPHPTSWLNGERYDDELYVPAARQWTGTNGYEGPWTSPEDPSDYEGDL